MLRRVVTYGFGALVVLFVLIQLVPYGRNHTNPAVLQEPAWDSPTTRSLAQAACFDCHSNETVWPWYSQVAPVSWLVARDVQEGRESLNFSEWGRSGGEGQEADELAEAVLDGTMPPPIFLLTHREARLSDGQAQMLAAGLEATARANAGGDNERGETHEAAEYDD